MADQKLKSKSSRSIREESKPAKRHYKEDTKYRYESKTPPLPTSSVTMEELIKQRESLKKELKKINSKNYLDTKVKLQKHNKYDKSKDNTVLKYKRKHSSDQKKDDKNIVNTSPDHIDSEDEESIIEQRRKRRKQLLEKFITSSHEHKSESIKEENIIESASSSNETDNQIQKPQITTVTKETRDMFSEKDDFIFNNDSEFVTQDNENNTQLIDNWDDPEGYYNTRIGDIIDSRYTIKCILGQGVFASVVRAHDIKNGNKDVAIKIIRNNDLMYKTGLKELSFLKEINDGDIENKYHCVKFIRQFMHKGHLCLVLESLHMDMRGVIKKYGKHGLNMKALMSYSRQLMLALRLLKKLGIIHADVKPDNILVNEKKNILKLCDFGSASKAEDNDATPYLVSRFYRAPEIILGIPYKHGVDIWSAACTIFEMATGKILFTGSSNNKMLKCFMDFKGKFPAKLLRKGKFKDQHFNYNNNFLLHKKDELSGREKVVEISNVCATKDLHSVLKKSANNLTTKDEKKLGQLKEFLDRILVYDAYQRMSILECLKHPFIQEELEK
ncbi:serine/threonine-protein kinase PRP4 homolog [Galleria mellonella]|uniref:Serine/threonine-protein kinase PRP4 homolog n=1 Tax=Galleria mellonella TaxID=7137 RepID=A0ABM3MXA9_GALME|nr:serine/threonine-protein kinase PRP4 homolog [Galleria mellonella]XP_052755842.1 serine/threonine-protein kinase PRP4 homolog [Galleria mellonella]XP_052755843.1 serine/threonine-protein kinase PRP4 homolog [Galleria mellonella]XP_052755844.1 serine/threonine-protein kinase PRP4 homolog [Galleria mellonella]XP_052755845.1 serine/threonine-protein kinase PRP4 homolog [Galleria mellonella]XP_052755846.1 serine/threonine-protein kinase PRP4 homolog [Galleria mellonella]XP_052755847.1 serine/t